jgi:DNA helicase-2/ATP-dependent DNA helicase PcrA
MPWLGTFHSIGVKILRRHAELVGLKPDFTILDVDDQIRLLKQLLDAEKIDEKRWPARVLASLIDGWKNRGLTPEQVPAGEAGVFANGKGLKLYRAYQERLKILNAADFGDLLLENIRLFREQPEVLRQYQARFKFILVDEYQDTNVAQYLWLRLLAQRTTSTSSRARGEVDAQIPPDEAALPPPERAETPLHPASAEREEQGNKNICCVGDDDQSIYGWRGAEVDNILRFEHDFPGAKVIRLERNYRSTGHILAAASHLIAHNEGRLGKTLRTDDVDGEKVTVTGAWDSEEEARAIGEEIEQLQRGGHSLNEVAILVRASFQMREFEDRFVTLGLPYRVIGGPRFYERAEIRDALAYLRLVNSPSDDLAFERIVNVPKRGLGDATVQLLHDHARKRRVPLSEAARAVIETDELKPKPRGALRGLLESFDRWRKQRDNLPHTRLAEIVLDESGYTEMWQKDRSADAAGRLENLKELIRSMEEFENLQGFLEHISLVMDNEKRQGPGIRHRVPAGLGGRRVSQPARARRPGPRRPGGRAPARACRADPRAETGKNLCRHQPAHARPVADQHSIALSRRIAGDKCGGHRIARRLRRLWGLRRLALRCHDLVRLELCNARLAARANQPQSSQARP